MKNDRRPNLDDLDHPSAAPPGRYPEDDELRAAGLEIHSRPPRPAEAVWRTSTGAIMTHGAALAMVRRMKTEARKTA